MKVRVESIRRVEEVYVWTVETEDEAAEWTRILGRFVDVGEEIRGTVTDS